VSLRVAVHPPELDPSLAVSTRRVTSQAKLSNKHLVRSCVLTAWCEDSALRGPDLCRIAADYEQFFNSMERAPIYAVEECRGIPDDARALFHEAFRGASVEITTRYGITDPVWVQRGVPQGSFSDPEAATPAQEAVLRLRESSSAAYVTSQGRPISTAGYVDDTQHYGGGAEDVSSIVNALWTRGDAGGIGFHWIKCSVYSTNWDGYAPSAAGAADGLFSAGVSVAGCDIWTGQTSTSVIPRIDANTSEKLLGNKGCISDHHSQAGGDTISKLKNLKSLAQGKRASWDEVA